ncbi:PREDICTED: prothymosin alpha-like [Ceratotherium simum simum]|uniref:Prothymosin alpha n=1 Tax=Ceratotherium simum simum TaxID=73337 RepID=A0ABM1CI39_CERSS|nr:PREDICTED: prothymosin alpha-like [Ceratotherium simum simum]
MLSSSSIIWALVRVPAGCPEKPSGLVPGPAPRARHCRGLRQLCGQSARALAAFSVRCLGSPACPIRSDAAADTSSEITTKDFKEKKEVVEEAENGRDAPANGNANEENGEQEADNQVDEEEEEGGGGGEEEEGGGEEEDGDEDDEDDDVDTKKQKTMRVTRQQKGKKLNSKKRPP